jgi:hypothetical protein
VSRSTACKRKAEVTVSEQTTAQASHLDVPSNPRSSRFVSFSLSCDVTSGQGAAFAGPDAVFANLGCVQPRRRIVCKTSIARIPSYTHCAALVLVCSLVVHALQVSLHQERAIVGASHGQFWSLAGGISGTLTAHDERAMASGCASYRAEVLVLATKGSRNAQAKASSSEGYALNRAEK